MKIHRRTIENDEEYLRQISTLVDFENSLDVKDVIKLYDEYLKNR